VPHQEESGSETGFIAGAAVALAYKMVSRLEGLSAVPLGNRKTRLSRAPELSQVAGCFLFGIGEFVLQNAFGLELLMQPLRDSEAAAARGRQMPWSPPRFGRAAASPMRMVSDPSDRMNKKAAELR